MIGALTTHVAILITKNAHIQIDIESELMPEMNNLESQFDPNIIQSIRKNHEWEFTQKKCLRHLVVLSSQQSK
jgi:hypothetical protein